MLFKYSPYPLFFSFSASIINCSFEIKPHAPGYFFGTNQFLVPVLFSITLTYSLASLSDSKVPVSNQANPLSKTAHFQFFILQVDPVYSQ
jgi:hypothetical protein